jgi:adenine-specific DNA-methyltransferase
LVESEKYAEEVTAERVRRVINGYKFSGTQFEELYRDSITYTDLRKADKVLNHVASIENLEKHRFDAIHKEVKDGVLMVSGEKRVTGRTEGLGGEFAFCTLGDPVDLDKLLTGATLPEYAAIGAWLFHTATGEALVPSAVKPKDYYLGESSAYHVWLIYKPELDFLKSPAAALTLSFAEKIAKAKKGKKHLVFAPAKFVPNKTLLPLGVEFSPLPYALYRVEKA